MAAHREYSRISPLGIGLTFGLLWGLVMFTIGTANYLFPPYGEELLLAMDSVYPGSFADAGYWPVVAGTVFGLVDAFLAGVVTAWTYNGILHLLSRT